MTDVLQSKIDKFEADAIAAVMAEGYSRKEAQDIFDNWLHRKWKRLQAQRFEMKLMAIR